MTTSLISLPTVYRTRLPGQPWRNGYVQSFRARLRDDAQTCGARIPGSLNISSAAPEIPHDLGDDLPCTIKFELHTNGPETEHFHGDFIMFFNRVDTNFQDRHDTPGWFGIAPIIANAVMPVPSRGAIVTVHHDNDGSKARVEISC